MIDLPDSGLLVLGILLNFANLVMLVTSCQSSFSRSVWVILTIATSVLCVIQLTLSIWLCFGLNSV